jgi:hypothetical protein
MRLKYKKRGYSKKEADSTRKAKNKRKSTSSKPKSTFSLKGWSMSTRGVWASLAPEIRRAIEKSWNSGTPPIASALYARWWQLETWLRSLVYVELRAAKGAGWSAALRKDVVERQQNDEAFHYMATPDAQDTLAYADAADLFRIIETNWNFFEPSLLAHRVWQGNVVELLRIRNRIGHCRRPHDDDLSRLEQTLRDMESGALVAVSSFNRQFNPRREWKDSVVGGWIRREHEDAFRLVEHAERQYKTGFELKWSRRPWSARPTSPDETISAIAGYVWHANWFFTGDPAFDIRRFWESSYLRTAKNSILFACVSIPPSSLEVSFPAVDDPNTIADAIGACFDAALMSLRIGNPMDIEYDRWREMGEGLDPRVQMGTAWSLIGDGDAVRIFSA